MNNTMTNEMNHYNDASQNLTTIEKAVLAEDVTFSYFEPVKGKFYIPSTTPSVNTGEKPTTKKKAGYTETNYVELAIPSHFLLMFMEPKLIPINSIKHNPSQDPSDDGVLEHTCTSGSCLLGFSGSSFKIPKNTEFIIEYLGGKVESEFISIVGIYSIAEAQNSTSSKSTATTRTR